MTDETPDMQEHRGTTSKPQVHSLQKKLVLAGSVLLVLSILFPPTSKVAEGTTIEFLAEWSFIGDMERLHVINWGVLVLEWVLIGGGVGLFSYMNRSTPPA